VSTKPLQPKNDAALAMDEAWWAALLADEEKHVVPSGGKAPAAHHVENKETANHTAPKLPAVDWDLAERLFHEDRSILLSVTGFNRGGLLVDGGDLHGFVPVSHLVQVACDISDEEREAILNRYVGKEIDLKVIECDPERGRVVFSERAAQAVSGRRNQLLQELKAGECVQGVVTNITDFGVFVDLGGVEGLIHVSEISWGRVNHPGEVVQVGEQVTAYVISLDRDRSRIALSLKRLCSNPWQTVDQRYFPGQVVDVIITSIVPFGAFARLEEGLDGLIHITEIEQSGQGLEVLKQLEGKSIRARILHIDSARQRLGLSLTGLNEF
jgi:small subunit ribosomal protein S1